LIAADASKLRKIYEGLNSRIVLETRKSELTAIFAGLAAGFAQLSAAVSLLCFNGAFTLWWWQPIR
jgi:Ca-activated chloride channel family protein